MGPIEVAYEASARLAVDEARSKARSAFRRLGQTVVTIFQNEEQRTMTAERFVEFICNLPDAGISQEEASMIFQTAGEKAIDRLQLACIVEEYMSCSKSAVMTKSFDLAGAAPVRKV